MADTKDLSVILDAKIPIIAVESPDEQRVLALLLNFATQRRLAYFEWTATQGMELGGTQRNQDRKGRFTEPREVLSHIAFPSWPRAVCAL